MSGKWQGGKGSDPRPITDKKKFDENWDRIFGKKEQEQKLISGIYESTQFTVDAAYQAFAKEEPESLDEVFYLEINPEAEERAKKLNHELFKK